jgi:post-segregation antitoxin (ccd killing protein)
MKSMGLPVPTFIQNTSESAVRSVIVTLSNNIKQRRAWIDQDVSKLVSEAIAADLNESEKQALNWAAANGRITISDANKHLEISWQAAQQLLLGLARKRIFQYVRFRPYQKDVRDPRAFFRLRSAQPLPDGAFEQSNLDEAE